MTDSYFPDAIPPMTRAERREHLSRRHGFECACAELCDREAFEVEETDRRVVKATALFGSALALARRLQGCNSIDISVGPESSPEPGNYYVSFEL